MRIDAEAKCKPIEGCDTYSPIPVEVAKSANVTKTNTLHQFDTTGIIGVDSPVGKVPIVFYIKEGVGRGRRGIIYYDDYDSVCWMYPETEHAEWCRQPYDIKYDKVEPFDNGVESGFRRNHGILELWVSVCRKWYNGQVMYRPHLKIQGCGRRTGGYPGKSTVTVVEEKRRPHFVQKPVKHKVNHSCGCRKGL